ncbi:MAG TPA: nitroreductase/quinone reductase family protein [Candidatus Limnocylindria bacterium]
MPEDWNRNMIAEFHAKHGKGIGHFGDQLLLLTTKGKKSGRAQLVPVAYHRDGDRYVIVASKSGAPSHPDWYRNLVAHPRATIEVGDEHFDVKATPLASGPERDRLYETHAKLMPGFRDYVKKTTRVIPVVVLDRIPPSSRG